MLQQCFELKADYTGVGGTTGNASINGNINFPPVSFQTHNEWKGTHGTVMEIHEIVFRWDINGTVPASQNDGIFNLPHGLKQMNLEPSATNMIQGTVKHEGMLRTAAVRQTNKWPFQERDGNAIAMCSREFWWTSRSFLNTAEGAPDMSIAMNDEGMVWNFRDGVGNGLRVGGNYLGLHWRVLFNDNWTLKTATSRPLYPCTNLDVTNGRVPDQFLRCFILFKWRDVDIHEWTRMHMENRDTI